MGEVVAIYTAPGAEARMTPVEEVRAVPGLGLEGDRYFERTGTYADKWGPHREATLIEVEAIEAVKQEDGVDFDAADSRRNIVTRGVALNHLVDREFTVGDVRFRGIRLCEPCTHMERVSGKPARKSLIHRGGLRAQILTEGTVRVGDVVAG
ncbi:MAG: MOSC domain-containing protein [Actinomycetota bacterium]|nr:MOSC domain-containing protein [Actinomycetota bacterium]